MAMSRGKILIVAESQMDSGKLQGIFERLQFQMIEVAHSCDEALQKLEASLLDGMGVEMMVVEWPMPQQEALRLLQFVKMESKLSQTVVIVTTGSSTPEAIVDVIQSGANDFIPKPFSLTQVQTKIKKFL